MSTQIFTIDAKDKTLGRVASEAAVALRGKSSASFERNVAPDVKVKIVNVAGMHIPEGKRKGKSYVRYTGYPGGLRSRTLEEMIEKKGIEEPLKLAVYGMIPNNKLRPVIMKNLIIEK
ncbi:MAG: 50S ribosomal protein L13 [Patescibacteria group bacterium]